MNTPSFALDFTSASLDTLVSSEAYFSGKASENTTLYITPGTGP
jgi:hypothetical protein